METIQFGLAENYDSGRSCNIANNTKLTIEVHNSQASSNMWYHIGHIDGANVKFGSSHKYSNGYHPSIAINNKNVVIEVHETSNLITNSIYYKIGAISGNSIDWGGDHKYDNGKQPCVSMTDNGVVLEVHKSQSHDTLYYRVGQIKGTNIDWGSSHKYDDGLTPCVSVNNNGNVVEVHKSHTSNILYYRIGQINGDKINWVSNHRYKNGITPNVGITNSGKVVEVHKEEGLTGLWQLVGQLNGNVITWESSSSFDSGTNPKVGISLNDEVAVQVHEGSSFMLWYSNAKLMNRADFLGNLLPPISHLPLKKMVLPASHDTGMYSGGLAGRTQDLNLYEQLSAGVRYFNLRLDGKLNIRHGIIYGPPLNSVLQNIQQFFEEGHNELAIFKFSHFNNFSKNSYQDMKDAVNKYLGKWLIKSLPQGFNRLADVPMDAYLQSGEGAILVVVDENWAIDYPEAGYWIYRDWDSDVPKEGDLTVYDKFADTGNLKKMISDQLKKFNEFDGTCKNDKKTPCDLFLLSWTLTPPITGVWLYAQNANRTLGKEMMAHRKANKHGYFPNLLYLDYIQYARPTFIADILLRSYNKINNSSIYKSLVNSKTTTNKYNKMVNV